MNRIEKPRAALKAVPAAAACVGDLRGAPTTITRDARLDRTARKYAKGVIADQAGYARTLQRTRALLKPGDRVLELAAARERRRCGSPAMFGIIFATDISAAMIMIADEKHAAGLHPRPRLPHGHRRRACARRSAIQCGARIQLSLHLVRDLPGTLRRIHALLAADGLFISKTPCVGNMNPLIRLVLPAMRAIGQAPYAGVFRGAELGRSIRCRGLRDTCHGKSCSGRATTTAPTSWRARDRTRDEVNGRGCVAALWGASIRTP